MEGLRVLRGSVHCGFISVVECDLLLSLVVVAQVEVGVRLKGHPVLEGKGHAQVFGVAGHRHQL